MSASAQTLPQVRQFISIPEKVKAAGYLVVIEPIHDAWIRGCISDLEKRLLDTLSRMTYSVPGTPEFCSEWDAKNRRAKPVYLTAP